MKKIEIAVVGILCLLIGVALAGYIVTTHPHKFIDNKTLYYRAQ